MHALSITGRLLLSRVPRPEPLAGAPAAGLLQAVFLMLGAGLLAQGLGNAAEVAGGTWFKGDRS